MRRHRFGQCGKNLLGSRFQRALDTVDLLERGVRENEIIPPALEKLVEREFKQRQHRRILSRRIEQNVIQSSFFGIGLEFEAGGDRG